ncbi:MAG: ankyrin repeat domain-containing protein [Dehalococcoidia bacterium]|nr:ankyrin repeat domain-containing protein [Dehalococcoidia bacterium]
MKPFPGTIWAGTAALLLVIAAIVACGPRPPGVSLLEAIDQEDVELVRAHMEFGTDPDEMFIPPEYPFAGASALHLAVLKDNEEIVGILLEGGANIDIKAREYFQGTPLDWAAFWGIKDMGVLLVEKGADVNSRTVVNSTPLDAAKADNPFIQVGQLEEFLENREFIQDYLAANGGKLGVD